MTSVVTAVLAVFTEFIDWLAEALGSVSTVFYNAENGLTFIGTISVIALAFSVALLIIQMIRGFLQQHS